MGQIEAVALGISRALEKMNTEWRGILKKASLLTCDGRIKERKKSRALEKMNTEWRGILKKASLLTCDGRIKERKKSGRPGARKRFQFSKR